MKFHSIAFEFVAVQSPQLYLRHIKVISKLNSLVLKETFRFETLNLFELLLCKHACNLKFQKVTTLQVIEVDLKKLEISFLQSFSNIMFRIATFVQFKKKQNRI